LKKYRRPQCSSFDFLTSSDPKGKRKRPEMGIRCSQNAIEQFQISGDTPLSFSGSEEQKVSVRVWRDLWNVSKKSPMMFQLQKDVPYLNVTDFMNKLPLWVSTFLDTSNGDMFIESIHALIPQKDHMEHYEENKGYKQSLAFYATTTEKSKEIAEFGCFDGIKQLCINGPLPPIDRPAIVMYLQTRMSVAYCQPGASCIVIVSQVKYQTNELQKGVLSISDPSRIVPVALFTCRKLQKKV
jgi:hypothetical protein